MWEVYLKHCRIFLAICCLFMLPLIILKLLGETSGLVELSGVLTLLLGLVGYIAFLWCPRICSKSVTVPISDNASFANEVGDDPCSPQNNYEVFISFRGEDTRDNFTSHLYDALCRKKIKTFIDNRLNRGEAISSMLLKTIEESEIFVIIFSKDYASSSWCLDELVKILECQEKYERLVIPIFYNVNPSNVRRQTGSYANSFIKHSKRFKNNMDKVHKWKAALTQASNLSGLDSTKIRPEPKLIGKVVKDILRKLKRISSYDLEGLVGIREHISKVESLLNIESQDVRIVGIWGMGGIGKTTLADAIYHVLQSQFESCSFVPSVEEQLRTKGLDYIRDKYVQELLEEEDIGMHGFRSLFVKKLLQRKKVLLVIDDVSNLEQIEDLFRGHDWFGPGSRIIITSRDMQVLKTANADKIYHVQKMSFDDALQLFSRSAFKQDLPIKDYLGLTKEALNYCEGNPLAIKVLGSFLKGKTKVEWENALKRLQNAPHKYIFEVLKLSFDGLDDDEKEIFLDIAVLYDGMPIDSVKELLVKCGFSADIGIRVLIDRSLISKIKYNGYQMHALIRAMGRKISNQHNVYKSGRGCRLWKHDDIYDALKKNKGNEEIYGISVDVAKIKETYLRSEVFEEMDNLQILRFCNSLWYRNDSSRLHISDGLGNFPEKLKFFQWDGYPHKSVPLDCCASNIVKLIMRGSNVKQLWDENQDLPNLTHLDLQGSRHLTGILYLSTARNIRDLNVSRCRNLSQVYSSTSLPKLSSIEGSSCSTLKTLNIGGNNFPQRRWKLHALHKFLIKNRLWSEFTEVSMKMLKCHRSNSYSFQFNYVSVPLTDISESKCMDSNRDSAVLRLVLANLKSILPNLQTLFLYDNPSSVGLLHGFHEISGSLYFSFDAVDAKDFVTPGILMPTESLCSPSMKGAGKKQVISSLDWEETDDSLTEDNIYNRLPKCISNNFRWECIKEVSLYRSDILTHNPSCFDCLLLSDYKRSENSVELTFSLDSQISELSIHYAEPQNSYIHLAAAFHGHRWSKQFNTFGYATRIFFYLDLSVE